MLILSIVGARPNFMKVAPVMRALDGLDARQMLVHTGQHYDANMSKIFFEELALQKVLEGVLVELVELAGAQEHPFLAQGFCHGAAPAVGPCGHAAGEFGHARLASPSLAAARCRASGEPLGWRRARGRLFHADRSPRLCTTQTPKTAALTLRVPP